MGKPIIPLRARPVFFLRWRRVPRLIQLVNLALLLLLRLIILLLDLVLIARVLPVKEEVSIDEGTHILRGDIMFFRFVRGWRYVLLLLFGAFDRIGTALGFFQLS